MGQRGSLESCRRFCRQQPTSSEARTRRSRDGRDHRVTELPARVEADEAITRERREARRAARRSPRSSGPALPTSPSPVRPARHRVRDRRPVAPCARRSRASGDHGPTRRRRLGWRAPRPTGRGRRTRRFARACAAVSPGRNPAAGAPAGTRADIEQTSRAPCGERSQGGRRAVGPVGIEAVGLHGRELPIVEREYEVAPPSRNEGLRNLALASRTPVEDVPVLGHETRRRFPSRPDRPSRVCRAPLAHSLFCRTIAAGATRRCRPSSLRG